MRNLSKSKIIAYRQCPKRLWLEIHKSELRDDSASEMVFQIGNQVGDMARSIYDLDGKGEFIDINGLGHEQALARSAVLLKSGAIPVFEAGMAASGALAYADVMLPDPQDGAVAWKMIEVKSSTSVKDYQRDDIAVQAHIAATAGIRLSSISLAHIDCSFGYPGNGDYQGLLKENDLTEEAISRREEVKEWIDGAQAVAALTDEPEFATGPHCNSPFTCGFAEYCNRDKVSPAYPLSSLPRLHPSRRERIEAAGHEDLRDVPDEFLGAIQNRVKQCSITGETYFDAAGAAADLAPYGFPAYFLDFETAMFAVPIWKGTRPYQQLPFQFSLHVLAESSDLQHHGFLDLSGEDPSRACAQSLVDLCGEQGPVFAYNAGFECRVMRELAARFPEFTPALESIIERVADLLPIARNRYYHPSQHGSWSIKAVLPAAIPELSYNQLNGVQDGGMAVSAFMEAINPDTLAERKSEIQSQLSSYCQLDTFAMVRLWQFFSGNPIRHREL
jgi:CRISPR/Cas system-associated exonuclease Cas4 (RecB family)